VGGFLSALRCPSCGAWSSGRFCRSCGGALPPRGRLAHLVSELRVLFAFCTTVVLVAFRPSEVGRGLAKRRSGFLTPPWWFLWTCFGLFFAALIALTAAPPSSAVEEYEVKIVLLASTLLTLACEGLLLHAFLKSFGASGGLSKTLEALCYPLGMLLLGAAVLMCLKTGSAYREALFVSLGVTAPSPPWPQRVPELVWFWWMFTSGVIVFVRVHSLAWWKVAVSELLALAFLSGWLLSLACWLALRGVS
jgi:hypothetical protein